MSSIAADLSRLAPGALVELFELDLSTLGGPATPYRFHAGTTAGGAALVWQGNAYTAAPIEASGFGRRGSGPIPRPRLKVANGSGAISALARDYADMVGARLTRKRTLVKYLDAANFPAANRLVRSAELSHSAWTKGNTAVAAAAAAAPDGSLTGWALTENSASGGHNLYQTSGADFVAGRSVTLSCYVKANSRSHIALQIAGSQAFNGAAAVAYFDVSAGTRTATGGTAHQASAIASAGSGWWRCQVTGLASFDGNAQVVLYLVVPTNVVSYAGDGTSGLYLWGPQLEQGAAATTYLPNGATAVRNPTADPNSALPDEVFYVDRKAAENKVFAEFELAPAWDLAGIKLPRRQYLQNLCAWRYRGAECGYTGSGYWDSADQSVATLGEDVCGKRLASCKLRFGATAELPFGGFPSVGLLRP